MVDYPEAIPMFVDEQRVFIDAIKDNGVYAIVLHRTASGSTSDTAQSEAQFFATNTDMKSVHYVIGKDGAIVQCVLEKDGAAGNCCLENGHDTFWDRSITPTNQNFCTISIEHCAYTTDNSDDMTDEQKLSSYKLVEYLLKKYGLTPDRIKGHYSLDPISRAQCPGNYDWTGLMNYLKGNGMPVPNGWTLSSDGSTLHAPNTNAVVVLGFKDRVLNDPTWNSENIPLQNETHWVNLVTSDLSYGPGQFQPFRDTALGYTHAKGVFDYPLGQEFLHVSEDRNNCRMIIVQLQNQINVLKNGLPQTDISNAITSINKLASDLGNLKT